jgi:hypothetical protein
MTTKVRMMIAGVTLVAVFVLVNMTGPSYAGGKDLPTTVKKIAEAIKKGDNDGAKKMAKDAAKGIEDMGDLMHMFKPRNKGGIGVGTKPGPNTAKDGIEVMIREYARDVPNKPVAGLEETGYVIAALAEIGAAKGWEKDQGKKTKKNWATWTADMKAAGLEFAKAGAGNGGAQIKAAASKVNNSCITCHNVFKE